MEVRTKSKSVAVPSMRAQLKTDIASIRQFETFLHGISLHVHSNKQKENLNPVKGAELMNHRFFPNTSHYLWVKGVSSYPSLLLKKIRGLFEPGS